NQAALAAEGDEPDPSFLNRSRRAQSCNNVLRRRCAARQQANQQVTQSDVDSGLSHMGPAQLLRLDAGGREMLRPVPQKLCSLLFFLPQLGNYSQVLQRGDVALYFAAGGEFAQ